VFDIKVRLVKLHLTQAWLISILYDMYGIKVSPSQLSSYISGQLKTPKAQRVLSLCNQILEVVEENEQEQAAPNTR
jgi:hypothetical protein